MITLSKFLRANEIVAFRREALRWLVTVLESYRDVAVAADLPLKLDRGITMVAYF